jgi:hypothetical protein
MELWDLGGIPRTSIGLVFRAVLFDGLAELLEMEPRGEKGNKPSLCNDDVIERCSATPESG